MNFSVSKLESRGYRVALRHLTFSHFDTIPECYSHTQTDTRRRHIPRLA